jgi:tetratricopeptide (TPR) repeat protein
MKKYFFVIVALRGTLFSFACGNEYHRSELPLENGKLNTKFLLEYDYTHDAAALPYWTHGFNINMSSETEYFLDEYKKNKDYKYLSDYAWELVKEGKAKQAIIILDNLLKTHTNEYNILANLGTAYEIVDNNSKALELLTKAIAINKNSHYGSEWIHLNILKQKLNNEAFPLDKIIDLGNENNKAQWNNATWAYRIPADSLLKSIAYQLHERIGFIPPKDKIIGRLIFDFAEIIAKTKSMEEALPFYDFAMYYDNELYLKVAQAKQAVPSLTTTTIESISNENEKKVLFLLASLAMLIIAFVVGRKTAKRN